MAEQYFDIALSLNPDAPRAYAQKAWRVAARLKGNIQEARDILTKAARLGIQQREVDYTWILLDLLDRNPTAALAQLESIVYPEFQNQFFLIPRSQFYAQAYAQLGDTEMVREYYEAARAVMEAKVAKQPEDAMFRSSLGIIYAGLDRSKIVASLASWLLKPKQMPAPRMLASATLHTML